MENFILRCLPVIESCSNNLCYTIDVVCNNICNLYDRLIQSDKASPKNIDERIIRKIERSYSDSKIKYSNSDNPDAWEMLQIRLV